MHAQEYEFGSALLQSVASVVTLAPSPVTVISHPALLGFGRGATEAEISYRQVFGLSELEDFALQGRQRFQSFDGALSITRFGESGLYQEYTIVGGASYRIGNRIAVGSALGYSRTEFGEDNVQYSGKFLTFSAAARIIAPILVSAAVQGLTLDRLYDEDETEPELEASVAWHSPAEVALGGVWTRERNGDHRFGLGQILSLGQHFDFLAGLRFDPVLYSLGGRVSYRKTGLVYSYQGHPDLGGTHSVGLSWSR